MQYLGFKLAVLAIMLSYIAIMGCDVMSFASGRYEMPFHSLLAIPHYPEPSEVDVCSFGATGDGYTDDTAAIQAAIDALSDGDTLFFPVGVYVTSSPLTISNLNKILVRGYGAGLKLASLYGGHNFALSIRDCKNVTIEGITFDRGNSYHPGEKDHGIHIEDSQDITVRDCDFSECADAVGVTVGDGTNERIHIVNCRQIGRLDYTEANHNNCLLCNYIFQAYDAVVDSSVVGCYQHQGRGLFIVGTESSGCMAKDNWVSDSHDSTIYLSGPGMVITGNICLRNGKDGIKTTNSSMSDRTIIANNRVEGAGYHNVQGGNLIIMEGANSLASHNILRTAPIGDLLSTSQNCIYVGGQNMVIDGNIIVGANDTTVDAGIVLQPVDADRYGVIVSNNVVSNMEYGVMISRRDAYRIIGAMVSNNYFCDVAHGIWAHSSGNQDQISKLSIMSNVVDNGTVYPIYVLNTYQTYICDNRLINIPGKRYFVGDCEDLIFKGNYCDGTGSTYITTAGINTYVYRGDNYDGREVMDTATLTFADGDVTPSMATYCPQAVFKTANTETTAITMFDDGHEGQVFRVIFGDDLTTIKFSAGYLKGNGGLDWHPSTGDHMTCVFDGINWYCDTSDNTP